jgi:hypothetical protein
MTRVSLQSDNVFGDDGGVNELGTVSGSVSSGLTVQLAVPVRSANALRVRRSASARVPVIAIADRP